MKVENLQASTESESLFQKRIAIHPRSVKGTFRTFKTAMLVLAYVIYFGLPWLPWMRNDAPAQAVLFDMVGRRFFMLFISAALLFFVTGLVGRAFCGYFCFQTVWTDAYIFIEKWVQGERPARLRLLKQPWNAEKIAKLGLTHGIWLLLSFFAYPTN